MTGGMGGGGGQAQPDQPYQEQLPAMQQQPQYVQQQPESGACAVELRQFMDCAQNTSDITFCNDFNEALKQCKQAYGKWWGITVFIQK